MTKKLLSILLAAAMTLCAASAFAAEAETLFIESDATSATVYGSSYLRCRILILDANGELATSFGGADITDATFTITAVNNGTDVTFSTDTATDSSPTFSYSSGDTISVAEAWQEFAVNVNDVDEVGDETIRVALKKGSSTITADLDITIKAPEANTYVVLTGGVGTTYDVLKELPAAGQDDKGATKDAGDSTTVDVFAAYYRSSDGKFYRTDNIPDEMLSPTISGVESTYNIGIASGAVTLEDGHASTTIQVKDLKLDDYLAYRVGTWNTAATQMAAMSWIMANGMTVTWSASAGYTRLIGAKFGDVNSSEQVEISMFDREKYYGSPTSYSSRTDRSFYTPGTCENITILGLPVNEVTNAGAHKESGTLAVTQATGTSNISPLDAYFLAPDPLKKPSGGAFKTAGDPTSSTKIYGAVVSYDQYNNPTPVSSGSNAANDTKIYLKHTNAAGSNTEAMNATLTTEVTLPSAYGTIGGAGTAYISNTYAYQAFFPFKMSATTGQTSVLTNCFIDQITVDGTAIDEDAFEDTVSTENLGIDFIAQNTIGAITQTVAAREALRLAAHKLPIRTKFVKRIDPISGQEVT